jgi:hypothetical protein
MGVTRRLVLLLVPLLALAAGDRKKQQAAGSPAIKVVEIAVRRSGSDRLIAIDGRIVNSGQRAIRGLVLIFEVTGMDGQVVSRQRGKIEEDPLAPGQESEFHWQMDDRGNAGQIGIRGVARDDEQVKVEEPGPYDIE